MTDYFLLLLCTVVQMKNLMIRPEPEEFVNWAEWTELNELNGGTWPPSPNWTDWQITRSGRRTELSELLKRFWTEFASPRHHTTPRTSKQAQPVKRTWILPPGRQTWAQNDLCSRRAFNTRPAGGGDSAPPPCWIFSIAQKRRWISMRNFQYLSQHQYDVCHQNFGKKRRKFLRKWCFSDVMFRHFG